MRNKNKSKLMLNLIIFGFFLIFTSYLDINLDKSGINLVANENDYTNINIKEIIKALEGETGVYLIVNNDKYTNRIINILKSLNQDGKIFLYNSKKDEIVLSKTNGNIEIVQQPSFQYNILLSKLGAYKDNYVIDDVITNYFTINTPIVLFINNGDIVYSYYLSNNKISDETLTELYSNGFKLIGASKKLVNNAY